MGLPDLSQLCKNVKMGEFSINTFSLSHPIPSPSPITTFVKQLFRKGHTDFSKSRYVLFTFFYPGSGKGMLSAALNPSATVNVNEYLSQVLANI